MAMFILLAMLRRVAQRAHLTSDHFADRRLGPCVQIFVDSHRSAQIRTYLWCLYFTTNLRVCAKPVIRKTVRGDLRSVEKTKGDGHVGAYVYMDMYIYIHIYIYIFICICHKNLSYI